MRSRLVVVGSIGTILIACSSDYSSSPFVVTDSAGVTIVESYEGLWAPVDAWALSPEPVISIGTADGPEEYSLHQVSAALRLPDGRIAIMNGGTDELRFYDSSGVFLQSVGRDGYGPGEFKQTAGMWLVSDSLVIWDFRQRRVSMFSSSGEFGRTFTLNPPPGTSRPYCEGVFSDGSILASTLISDSFSIPDVGMGFSAIHRDYRRYSRDGVVLDSLGVFLEAETVAESTGSGSSFQRIVGADSPFGRNAWTIAFGDNLYHGSSDSYEIQVFGKDGGLQRIIRRPVPNPPVTERDKESYREDWLATEANSEWRRRRVDELEYPETKPAYGRIRLDVLGNIWVDEYRWRNDYDATRNYTVFDTAGRMLGVVQGPPRFGIADIGEDYIIGVWRDDMDVPYVRMYQLFKN